MVKKCAHSAEQLLSVSVLHHQHWLKYMQPFNVEWDPGGITSDYLIWNMVTYWVTCINDACRMMMSICKRITDVNSRRTPWSPYIMNNKSCGSVKKVAVYSSKDTLMDLSSAYSYSLFCVILRHGVGRLLCRSHCWVIAWFPSCLCRSDPVCSTDNEPGCRTPDNEERI